MNELLDRYQQAVTISRHFLIAVDELVQTCVQLEIDQRELDAAREVVRAARDFLPQENTSGGIGREDWDDLRATIAAFDAHKAGL